MVFDEESNSFILSSDKLQNIYNFNNHLQFTDNSTLGTIHLLQNYYGNGTPTTSIRSYQETQSLKFQYQYEVIENISFINRNNWFLSSNTLNFGQNKLERLNFLLGGKYQSDNSNWFDIAYGKERNTTIGLETIGDYISSHYKYLKSDIYGFDLVSNGYFEQVKLNDGRENNDLNLDLATNKQIENNSSISFGVNYLNRGRDNPEINPIISDILIRRRKQNRLNTNSSLFFKISENVSNYTNIGLNNENISNSFTNNYLEIQDSEFKRQINIFEYDIRNTIGLKSKLLNSLFFINFRKLNEDYEAVNYLNKSEDKYETYRVEQNRQDKIETYFNINFDNGITLTERDSLSIIFNYKLLRYDTPSSQNNDDRDELALNLNIEYLTKLSNNIQIGFNFESRNYHYVYLKSQRSSSNNWNRILRLSPTFVLQYDGFYYNPKLGINANYTTYDFENSITSVNSFSFREISYFDTLQVKIESKIYLESRSYLKYSERGILYWDSFSEEPQRANFEYYQNLLLIKRQENNNLGIGIRYFKRKDTRLRATFGSGNSVLNDFESISPQILFVHNFLSGNSINFDLWYEFQTINSNIKQKLINFYLTLNIKL